MTSTTNPRLRQDEGRVALERYRRLLQHGGPAAIERAHAEAFARLTPLQQHIVFRQLSFAAMPGDEPDSSAPGALARSAALGETRLPGFLEHTFGSGPFGGAFGGSMLDAIAGIATGSMLAVGHVRAPLRSRTEESSRRTWSARWSSDPQPSVA